MYGKGSLPDLSRVGLVYLTLTYHYPPLVRSLFPVPHRKHRDDFSLYKTKNFWESTSSSGYHKNPSTTELISFLMWPYFWNFNVFIVPLFFKLSVDPLVSWLRDYPSQRNPQLKKGLTSKGTSRLTKVSINKKLLGSNIWVYGSPAPVILLSHETRYTSGVPWTSWHRVVSPTTPLHPGHTWWTPQKDFRRKIDRPQIRFNLMPLWYTSTCFIKTPSGLTNRSSWVFNCQGEKVNKGTWNGTTKVKKPKQLFVE